MATIPGVRLASKSPKPGRRPPHVILEATPAFIGEANRTDHETDP